MKRRTIAIVLAAALLGAGADGGGGAWGLYGLGRDRKTKRRVKPAATPSGSTPQKPGDIDPASGKRVLYWHDPMVPGQKFDKPGKSPFMDMQLVPVYEDG